MPDYFTILYSRGNCSTYYVLYPPQSTNHKPVHLHSTPRPVPYRPRRPEARSSMLSARESQIQGESPARCQHRQERRTTSTPSGMALALASCYRYCTAMYCTVQKQDRTARVPSLSYSTTYSTRPPPIPISRPSPGRETRKTREIATREQA